MVKLFKSKNVDKFPLPPYLFKMIEPRDQVLVSCLQPGEKVWESVPIKSTDGEIKVIVYWKGIIGTSLLGEPRGFLVLKNGEPVSRAEAKTLLELLFVTVVYKEENVLKDGLKKFIDTDLQSHYQLLGDMVKKAKTRFAGDGIDKYFAEGKAEDRPDIPEALDKIVQMAVDIKRIKRESVKTGSKLLELAKNAFNGEVVRLENLQRVFDQFVHDSQVVQEFYNVHAAAEEALANAHVFIKNVILIEKDKEAKAFALEVEPHLKTMRNISSEYKRSRTIKGIYENFQDDMLKRFVYLLVRN
jgi:hypothetical protein